MWWKNHETVQIPYAQIWRFMVVYVCRPREAEKWYWILEFSFMNLRPGLCCLGTLRREGTTKEIPGLGVLKFSHWGIKQLIAALRTDKVMHYFTLNLHLKWNLPNAGKTTGSDKNRDKKRYQRIFSWCKRFALPFFDYPILLDCDLNSKITIKR